MTATSDTHPDGDRDSPGPAATRESAPSDGPATPAGPTTSDGSATPAANNSSTELSSAAAGSIPPPDARARPAARKPRKPAKQPFQATTLARRYPTWGSSTLGLLVGGVVAGYVMLVSLGPGVMHRCLEMGPACDPRDQARGMALPVLGMVVGLVISVFGGRLLASRGREPMPAAWAGWALFVISLIVTAFILV